jgi:uncharacterized LabA/DUF88 family protein
MKPFRRNKNQPNQQQKGNYAFIDSQNLNLGVQKMGWKMDWRKFRQFLRDVYGVEKAFMFIGYMPENEKLYDQMHESGYLIVLKPTLDMFHTEKNEEGRVKNDEESKEPLVEEKKQERPATKGNVDAELVLYAVKEMPNYRNAVIVSGDGDFYGLVEYLAEQQKLEKLLAPNWQYSSLLKPFDQYIVRLDQKRHELSYRGFNKKPNKKANTITADSLQIKT